jgi:hypothetical protein
MPRLIPTLLTTATLAFVLAGCVGTSPAPSTSPSLSPSPSASPTPSPSATPTAGCPATPGTTAPAAAVTAAAIDVDGDGRIDTEWIAQIGAVTRFGVTTASGATFSYDVSSASPIARGGFVARLTPELVISLLSDGRGAYLHTIANCAFVEPTDTRGAPYTFDLESMRGTGTGVGCVPSGSDLALVGYLATTTNDTVTVKQTVIRLNAAGTIARNGTVTTVAQNVPSTDPIVVLANSVTCGSVTIPAGGVTLPEG